jgi:hypothetical protein
LKGIMTSFVLKVCVIFIPWIGWALVEFPVRLRQAVDVVQRVVAVDDLQRLPHLDAEHVRRVMAALLIEDHRRRWRRERAIAETILHVHEHVADRAVLADDLVLGRESRIRLLTVRIGAEFDGRRRGCRSRERDFPGHRRSDRGVDSRRRRCRRAGAGRHRVLRILVGVAAAAGNQERRQAGGQKTCHSGVLRPPIMSRCRRLP